MSARYPWPAVVAGSMLLMVLAVHALAALLGVPTDDVWYAVGQSIGFLLGLAVLAALIIQLTRR